MQSKLDKAIKYEFDQLTDEAMANLILDPESENKKASENLIEKVDTIDSLENDILKLISNDIGKVKWHKILLNIFKIMAKYLVIMFLKKKVNELGNRVF